MAKNSKQANIGVSPDSDKIFQRPGRLLVPVPHHELDQTLETSQGEERTVRQLFEDYVLGRLDMRDLGGKVQYDPDDSDDVDPMNQFGLTLEESTEIQERGAAASREMQELQRLKQEKQLNDAVEKRVQEELAKRTPTPPKSE